MENGLVSVIIPVYNREDTIKRAVDSVLNQTYKNLEVIVVDDGSTDNTVQVVEGCGDSRVNLVRMQGHGGANRARNIGVAKSKGYYIAFQDSDDEWLPEKLYKQIEFMEKEDCPACYCAHNIYEDGLWRTFPYDYASREKYQSRLREILTKYNVISTQTLIVKRESLGLMENKWFDEFLPRLQDYDLVIRMVQVMYIGYINQPLVNVYRSETCITGDIGALYKAVSQLISKHWNFLDMEDFFKISVLPNIISGTEESLIEGLNMIQASLNEHVLKGQDIDIKAMVISRMMEQIKLQDNIGKKQYDYNAGQLISYNFSIYGAGNIGRKAYRKLKAKGIIPKYFIVTKCEKGGFIDDVPIVPIDEDIDKDNPVIIGISKEHQAELMDNLISRGFKNFFVYSE